MAYRPISCLDDPVEARWGTVMRGPYEEDDEGRLERVAEEREERERDARRDRYFERLAEVGLSRPLFETAQEVDDFLAELVEGVRGPGA
jgi:hypothetical protein